MVVIVGIAQYWKVPYYTIAPGSARPTEPLVKIDGHETYQSDGEIAFTTISFGEASALSAFAGWLDPSVEVVEADKALGGQQPDENRKRNLEMMDSSKQTAQVVALRKLGYDVKATGTGAVIKFVKADAPVASVLAPNDVVVAVDGKPVTIADELVDAIGAKKPGDRITLKIELGKDGQVVERETTVVSREDDASRPMLGVQAGTRNITFQLPFQVSIDSGEVGGPSAGLAFTLGVIDVLTPGSLTGGRKVATTGTIDLRGNVGPVGGVPQKTVAVRNSGAELFLVPPDEYDEALRFAGSMKVMPVSTLDEALKALADVGHDPEAVALATQVPKAES